MSGTLRAYVHASGDPVAELERLRLLEDRYDEGTFRRIAGLGRLDGASCLEVGAGAGSVANWLAGAVGTGGRVVATDADPRFLGGLAEVGVEVWRHDILTDPLPAATFDLVHCRALLFHLAEPQRALGRMTAALRPGGWLLVEDADYVSVVAATPEHPLAGAFDRGAAAIAADGFGADLYNPYVGRRLGPLVAATGLADLGVEAIAHVRSGGSGPAELFARSVMTRRDEIIARGALSAAEFDALFAALADPSFCFVDALSFAAWGRRP
jgi:SAM-dependent methyltransferase